MPVATRLTTLLLCALITACVNVGTLTERQEKARQLSHDLQQLRPSVSAREADRLATAAIEESARMSTDFKPLVLPWANNSLVNVGLRKRGLCYQWRDDLFPHLFNLRSKTMDLHLTSAHRGTVREHNGIIVTAKGQPFDEGIVLDPWRHGGRLWWGHISADKKYPWKPLPWELTPVVLRPLLMPELYPSR